MLSRILGNFQYTWITMKKSKEGSPAFLDWLPLGRMMGDWKQPEENSIEALQHGILFGDGVEFDI